MSGYLPFGGDTQAEIFKNIMNCELHFEHSAFDKRSDKVLDLIERLLMKDPKKRLTAAEALEHVWFKEVNTNQ